TQELTPGRTPPRSWSQPMAPEQGGHRSGRDPDSELEELSPDPLVAPPGVLPSQPQDQVSDLRIQGGPTGRTVGPGPLPGHELAVPPQQRLRPDQEGSPPIPGQDPASGCQEGPIGWSKDGPLHLPPEHGELVAQHHDLDVF